MLGFNSLNVTSLNSLIDLRTETVTTGGAGRRISFYLPPLEKKKKKKKKKIKKFVQPLVFETSKDLLRHQEKLSRLKGTLSLSEESLNKVSLNRIEERTVLQAMERHIEELNLDDEEALIFILAVDDE